MKVLIICICLLQDSFLLKARQRTKEPQHILLRLIFPPFYNSYNKSCCKLYAGRCYKLLDSAGYTFDSLRGRVTTTEKDGLIEFNISHVQAEDAGFYRCSVLGSQTHIYADYYVKIFEVSDYYRQSQPPMKTTTTISAFNSSTVGLDSTGHVLVQDNRDRSPWNFGVPLFFIVSITAVISAVAMIGAVCCKVKSNLKKSNIFGTTLSESGKQEALETRDIIYATVNFKPHQKPEELYANLGEHIRRTDNGGPVEYSMLALQL